MQYCWNFWICILSVGFLKACFYNACFQLGSAEIEKLPFIVSSQLTSLVFATPFILNSEHSHANLSSF